MTRVIPRDLSQPRGLREVRGQERERTPTGRIGGPRDVADWILRIADPRGTHVTGQILTVDGGLELS